MDTHYSLTSIITIGLGWTNLGCILAEREEGQV